MSDEERRRNSSQKRSDFLRAYAAQELLKSNAILIHSGQQFFILARAISIRWRHATRQDWVSAKFCRSSLHTEKFISDSPATARSGSLTWHSSLWQHIVVEISTHDRCAGGPYLSDLRAPTRCRLHTRTSNAFGRSFKTDMLGRHSRRRQGKMKEQVDRLGVQTAFFGAPGLFPSAKPLRTSSSSLFCLLLFTFHFYFLSRLLSSHMLSIIILQCIISSTHLLVICMILVLTSPLAASLTYRFVINVCIKCSPLCNGMGVIPTGYTRIRQVRDRNHTISVDLHRSVRAYSKIEYTRFRVLVLPKFSYSRRQ